MATIKCENCGTTLEISDNASIVFCHNCGTKCSVQKNDSKDVFLKRGFLALEDKEWKKADEFFEQVLNIDPECGVGYLGKLMADLKVSHRDELKNCSQPFNETNNYKKIMRFGSDELKNELIACIDNINNRNDENQIEKDYAEASKIANNSKNIQKILKASEKLADLGDYKDAPELAKSATEKAKLISEKKDKRETKAIKVTSILSSAVALLIIITIVITTVIVPAVKYNNAKKNFEKGNYKEAIIVFSEYRNYKDSNVLFEESLKNIAIKETFAAGGCHTIALKSDGTVVATGKSDYYENYEYSYYSYTKDVTDSVKNWKDIVAVSAGADHTVGLKADGTVVAVGDEDSYKTYEYHSSYYYDSYETLEESALEWKDIVSIAAGYYFTAGLKSDGTVVVAGDDDFYVSDWTDIIDIAAGGNHIIGLKADGTVVATGSDDYYEFEDFGDVYYDNDGYQSVEYWEDIVAISAGSHHTVGLKSDGTVVALGENDYGQCNVEDWKDIVAIAAGGNCTVGLKADGTVVTTGRDSQCDAQNWTDIIAISVGESHVVGMKSDGTLVAVGSDFDTECDVKGFKGIKKPAYIQ